MVKRYGAEEQNDKDDRAIDEDLKNDNKINQQGHHIWTLIKIMQRFCTVLGQVVKHQEGLRNNFAKGQFKLKLSNRNMKKWMKKAIDQTEDVGRNDGLRAGFKK